MLGLVAFDDLDARESRKVLAVAHRHLVLDDREIDLDLSEEHDRELREFLEKYLSAKGSPSASVPAYGPGGMFKERREYLAAFRKWADAQDPPVVYRSEKGNGYYYPVKAMKRFDEHMREKFESGLGSD